MKSPAKISSSMILYFMVSITLFFMLGASAFYFFTRSSLEEEMGKRLIAIASITAQDITPWLLLQIRPGEEKSRSYQLIRAKLLKTIETGQIRRAYITDLENKIIVDSSRETRIGASSYENQLYRDELVKVGVGIPIHTTYFEDSAGSLYKSGFVPILKQQKVVAILGVQASADFFTALTRLKIYFIYALAIISMIIVAVSILISKKLVKPIEELVEASRRIGTGDLETPVERAYENEFGSLASSIEEMRLDLLEKDNRMKTMLQGIAHEIRNPLGGIELFAGLLAEEIQKPTDDQVLAIGKIQQEVENLKSTIEQFLDFARDHSPQLQDVKGTEFLEDIIYSQKLIAEEKSVKLTLDRPQDLLLSIDERLMKSAITNLVRNAIQAIDHQKGEVKLSLTRGEYKNKNGFNICIEDNGKGIAKDDLVDLFRPFFTTKEKGCGLGLAFCQKIVHAHGGHIRVDSAPGRGTLMTVWLPLEAV